MHFVVCVRNLNINTGKMDRILFVQMYSIRSILFLFVWYSITEAGYSRIFKDPRPGHGEQIVSLHLEPPQNTLFEITFSSGPELRHSIRAPNYSLMNMGWISLE
jgi:hypothetical protein